MKEERGLTLNGGSTVAGVIWYQCEVGVREQEGSEWVKDRK